jgi:hypothetical protein
MTRFALAFLAGICFLFAAAAGAADREPDRNIDELMRKSGLWKQVGEMEALMQLGISQGQAEAHAQGSKVEMGEADLARLKAAAAVAYAPERLRKEVASVLAQELTPVDEGKVLEWLSSDLGRRITELEEKDSGAEASVKREQAGPALLATLPKVRVDKFRRLGQSVRIGEAGAAILINTTLGVMYGIALATPPYETQGLKGLRDRFDAQRPQLAAALEERSIAQFAWVYQPLTDEEVEEYVVFSESPPGRKYNEASIAALDKALAHAAIDLGIEFGAKSGGAARKS